MFGKNEVKARGHTALVFLVVLSNSLVNLVFLFVGKTNMQDVIFMFVVNSSAQVTCSDAYFVNLCCSHVQKVLQVSDAS